jgi:hypothetical protein
MLSQLNNSPVYVKWIAGLSSLFIPIPFSSVSFKFVDIFWRHLNRKEKKLNAFVEATVCCLS